MVCLSRTRTRAFAAHPTGQLVARLSRSRTGTRWDFWGKGALQNQTQVSKNKATCSGSLVSRRAKLRANARHACSRASISVDVIF